MYCCRMGVACGPLRSVSVDHLGRADYHAVPINMAARYEMVCAQGGQVVCDAALAAAAVAEWNSLEAVAAAEPSTPLMSPPATAAVLKHNSSSTAAAAAGLQSELGRPHSEQQLPMPSLLPSNSSSMSHFDAAGPGSLLSCSAGGSHLPMLLEHSEAAAGPAEAEPSCLGSGSKASFARTGAGSGRRKSPAGKGLRLLQQRAGQRGPVLAMPAVPTELPCELCVPQLPAETFGVEVHQLGRFQVKGAAGPVEVVQVTLAHLAARRHLLQQLPPKHPKGHCLQPLAGLVAAVDRVRLPGMAQLYQQQHQQRCSALTAARQQHRGERLPAAAASTDLTLRQRSVVSRASGVFGSMAAASGRAFSWAGSGHSLRSSSSSHATLMGLALTSSQQQQQQLDKQPVPAGVQVSMVPLMPVSGGSSGVGAGDDAAAQHEQQHLLPTGEAGDGRLGRPGAVAADAATCVDSIV
ncbi:hypothetical protein COO60DRAFT_375346 [Scenedesmus sp. NREL 46B-D3]|nr:hypothetical protein COO60DRAFT_375346 [Scenedesmus sp. NREL 46B-D3]